MDIRDPRRPEHRWTWNIYTKRICGLGCHPILWYLKKTQGDTLNPAHLHSHHIRVSGKEGRVTEPRKDLLEKQWQPRSDAGWVKGKEPTMLNQLANLWLWSKSWRLTSLFPVWVDKLSILCVQPFCSPTKVSPPVMITTGIIGAQKIQNVGPGHCQELVQDCLTLLMLLNPLLLYKLPFC